MRRLLVASFLFSLTAACGGRAIVDPVDPGDSGTDTGESDTASPPPDTGIDPWDTSEPPPDTGPHGCGWGVCTPGEACFDGCNSCTCDPSGGWTCTARDCWDSGPPPPPPPDSGPTPTCPGSLPANGSWCPGPLKCNYMNSCGTTDFAYCDYYGGRWVTSIGPCTGSCPATLPKDGTACMGASKCEYWKPCGTYDYAYCDTSTGRWRSSISECPPPPPPPPTCPTTAPKEGTACTGYATCAWNNGCGSLLYGYCEGGRWWLSDTGCVSGCPGSKPTSGAACKPPSSTSCTYVTSSTGTGWCESSCFCAEDYRWACIPGGCSSSGGGGWADAGPPTPADGGIPPSW